MTNNELAEVERLLLTSLLLSPAQQYRLAFLIAENLNHLIVPACPSTESERHKAFCLAALMVKSPDRGDA